MQQDYKTITQSEQLIKETFVALTTLNTTSKGSDMKTSSSSCHAELSAALCDRSLTKEDHFPSSVSGSQC